MLKQSLLIIFLTTSIAQIQAMLDNTITLWDLSGRQGAPAPEAPPAPGVKELLLAEAQAEAEKARKMAGLTIKVQGRYVYAKAAYGPEIIYDFINPEYPRKVTAEEVKAEEKAAQFYKAKEKGK